MEEITQVVLKLPENDRCDNAEVALMVGRYAVVLHIFDAIFSIAR
jgi:hypothetical protein